MTERAECAVAMFLDGYNCAQSVLASYAPALGLDQDTALKLSAPLGGGVSRSDGICGAVSGALLVLGLEYGHTDPEDEVGAERIRLMTQEYLRRYADRTGGTDCTGLLGHDLSRPGVAERVKDEGIAQDVCPTLVRTSCEILEALLEPEEE